MLKGFIVDDEPLARDELAYLLGRTRQVHIVGEADSLETALQSIAEMAPDVVFLDIQLAEDNGLELAKQLSVLEQVPDIVFATAYDEYALQAFEVNALDYILKPFEEERVRKTVDKVMKLRSAREKRAAPSPPLGPDRTGKLAVSADERILLIDIDNIVYVGSEDGKSELVTTGDRYKLNEPLVNLERRLAGTSVVRVHRSYLANLNAVTEIQPWFNSACILVMKDESKVPVSRSFTKELKQLLGL
ncbi:LytTR family transcriptional regulator DNA-binding domain-containing protein [Paenibacillus cellulositrophicus]|uniref:LytR/AlgR family response regulator transcription factor n=1 Tax=Paenibacillus cellulositrophicus TaxID=562959 RepID=UPI00203F88AE|nr:LytTR family transcriptional regulator DNA-binding domain-containing protein [Paenibacillus cellulositrophicus]MCM2998479.1 LytTR family transcriptional regulator DNA-binding domain-containing protein [Paenibacillus cellulositrophicus]